MTTTEVEKLNQLLSASRQWSRNAEAHDAEGTSVNYDDPAAVSWSLDGAVFRVMGPDRAMEQMVGFTAHMLGQSTQRFMVSWNPPVLALATLKNYNDLVASFLHIRLRLRDLPVEGVGVTL